MAGGGSNSAIVGMRQSKIAEVLMRRITKDIQITLDDLLDIVELIRVRRINEMKAREAQNG